MGAHGKRQKVRRTPEECKRQDGRSEERSSEKSKKGNEECRRPKKDRSGEGHERSTLTRKKTAKPST